jgi:hypothetical protein
MFQTLPPFDGRANVSHDLWTFPTAGSALDAHRAIAKAVTSQPALYQPLAWVVSTGSPVAFHSGYPSSSRKALKPRLRSSATASYESTQYCPRVRHDLLLAGHFA